jgi:hypothetical protein
LGPHRANRANGHAEISRDGGQPRNFVIPQESPYESARRPPRPTTWSSLPASLLRAAPATLTLTDTGTFTSLGGVLELGPSAATPRSDVSRFSGPSSVEVAETVVFPFVAAQGASPEVSQIVSRVRSTAKHPRPSAARRRASASVTVDVRRARQSRNQRHRPFDVPGPWPCIFLLICHSRPPARAATPCVPRSVQRRPSKNCCSDGTITLDSDRSASACRASRGSLPLLRNRSERRPRGMSDDP